MNEEKLADVIILGRGGGSLEDLWPFNEEIVARAIYESELPIISAVGHETDFSISDFVADLRAPTPSAAAELAVPNIIDVKENIEVLKNRYKVSLKKRIELMKLRYINCMSKRVFKDPLQNVNEKRILLDNQIKEMDNSISNILSNKKSSFEKIITKLDALSPLKTLIRGYSITEKDGKIVKSIKEVDKGDLIEIKFSDGSRSAEVK